MKITPERFFGLLKSGWHIALLMGGFIWAVASYKANLDVHLTMIDNQLKMQNDQLKTQDDKLTWLITHHADKNSMPQNDPSPYSQQSLPIKPQSFSQPFSLLARPTLVQGIGTAAPAKAAH